MTANFDQGSDRQSLKQAILAHVVEEALHAGDQEPCVLRSALDLAAAMEGLSTSGAAQTGNGEPSSQQWLTGSEACPLGVLPEQLEAQLPNMPRLQVGGAHASFFRP
jgi:hypothetical protein